MKLREIAETYHNIQDMIENDDVSEELLKNALEALEDAAGDKIENLITILQIANGENEIIEQEIKRLTQRLSSRKRKCEEMKRYLQYILELMNVDKIKTPLYTVTIQKNSQPSVRILSEEAIPKDFWIEQKPTLNKKALSDFLKTGMEIPGVELEYGHHLRIR